MIVIIGLIIGAIAYLCRSKPTRPQRRYPDIQGLEDDDTFYG